MSPFVSAEYFAAMRRMLAECGESRKSRTGPPGYYSLRIVAALNDPTAAGPHLARAVKLWSGRLPPCWTETGEQIPEGYDFWVRQQRAWMDAIDADDEAEGREQVIRQATDSPFLDAEESKRYLGLPSVKALYSLVERVCKAKRKRRRYKFTEAELDQLRLGKDPWEAMP